MLRFLKRIFSHSLTLGAVLSFFLPCLAFAAKPKNFADLVRIFTNILNSIIPALFSLALLLFFWGVARFILNTSDEKAVIESRKTMFYGVIALFVIFSIWGIIRLLVLTFLGA